MARILIIDDDDGVRRLLERVLERAGHSVLTARDGEAGLAAARQARPDLVITDIFMPEREGLSTIVELRRIHPDVPVIAISGGGMLAGGDYLSVARDMGADRVLPKPLQISILRDVVHDLLQGRDASAVPGTAGRRSGAAAD